MGIFSFIYYSVFFLSIEDFFLLIYYCNVFQEIQLMHHPWYSGSIKLLNLLNLFNFFNK